MTLFRYVQISTSGHFHLGNQADIFTWARHWFEASVASRFLVVVGPLFALFFVALVAGWATLEREASLAPIVLRSLAVAASLGWAFIGIGYLISAYARAPEQAVVLALSAWATVSALHDFALIGLLLRVRLEPVVVFVLAALNPVEAARIGILGAVDPELSVLGPVGFWLANALGPTRTLLVGVAWPFALGTLTMAIARQKFQNADLVG